MRRLSMFLGRVTGAATVALLAALVGLATVDAAAWSILERSWAPMSEVQGVLAIWFGLLGAAWGVKRRFHIGVELVTGRLPEGLARVVDRAASAAVALFGVLVAYHGARLAASVVNTLPASGLPASVQYVPAVVCGALIALFATERSVWPQPPTEPATSTDRGVAASGGW